MSTEFERPEDDLRLVVSALREHLAWQESCGAYGLPRAVPTKRSQTVDPIVTAPTQRAALHDPPPPPSPPSSNVRREQPMLAPVSPPEHPPVRPPVRPPVSPPVRPPVSPPVRPPVRPQPKPARTTTRVEPIEVRAKRLSLVQQQASTCTRCPLHKGRTNVVYGVGPLDVEIMIVGEAPGADEDAQGEPFVGKAGELLDRMLVAMGFARSDVYIANVVKCRPADNRVPDQDEIKLCMPYLDEQIELVRPKVIIAMGATAIRGLLDMGGITHVRGRWKLYKAEVPVMPTFHPAHLLYNQSAKREVWDDLQAVLKQLNREVPKRK